MFWRMRIQCEIRKAEEAEVNDEGQIEAVQTDEREVMEEAVRILKPSKK